MIKLKNGNFPVLALLAACLLTASCSAGAGSGLDQANNGNSPSSTLPGVNTLAAIRGGSAEKSLLGSDFIAQSNCFPELDSVRVNISIMAVQRNGSELGWAAYRFTGLSGLPQELAVHCGLPMPGTEYFVSVASRGTRRWVTFGPFDSEEALIDLAQAPGAISQQGELDFAVLARGHNVMLHHSSTLRYATPETP